VRRGEYGGGGGGAKVGDVRRKLGRHALVGGGRGIRSLWPLAFARCEVISVCKDLPEKSYRPIKVGRDFPGQRTVAGKVGTRVARKSKVWKAGGV